MFLRNDHQRKTINDKISVSDEYLAQIGSLFDYPTRRLNDPSHNKQITRQRLEVTPTIRLFTIKITTDTNEGFGQGVATIDVAHENSLKVIHFFCASFTYPGDDSTRTLALHANTT